MKARVKATGESVEVVPYGDDMYIEKIGQMSGRCFPAQKLDFDIENILDYWEKLKHQYAGMALSRLVELVNHGYEYVYEEVAILATNYATALVEKLKEDK